MTNPAPAPTTQPASAKSSPQGTQQTPPQPTAMGRVGSLIQTQLWGNSPQKLRTAMAASVLVSLLLGVIGFAIAQVQASRLGAVADRTEQTVDLLGARADLVTADGTATNSFLIGGLEPSSQRADYDSALAAGAAGLAQQAGSPQDSGDKLANASAALTSYSGLVERARANNRQGFPVGAAYLNQASTSLSSAVLPPIDDVVVDTADEAASDLGALTWAVVAALLLLAAVGFLVAVQVWLARRTRRTINVPMGIATALAAIVVLVGFITFWSTQAKAHDVRQTSYRATLSLSQALSLAGEARSDESFTLIRRGSGASYQQSFQTTTAAARKQLERAAGATDSGDQLVTEFDAWLTGHERIRKLDDGGNWDAAVALATSREASSPSTAYEKFVTDTKSRIADESTSTNDRLTSGQTWVSFTGWLLALAGLVAMIGSWIGLGRRLEEYR